MEYFFGLAMGMMVAFLTRRAEIPQSPKYHWKFLKGTGEKLQEDVLKFGSVCDLVQELCHGICQAQS